MTTDTLPALLRAEWTKIRTLRATSWALALVPVLATAVAAAGNLSVRVALDRGSDRVRPDFDPVGAGFTGLQIGQFALIAFGVLVIGGEYGSGRIRTSLTAVPCRDRFFAGKALTVAALALPAGALGAALSFGTGQLALGPHGVGATTGDAPRALLGAPLYCVPLCLFALGTATVLRSTALSLTVLFAQVFVVTPVLARLPGIREVARYLPDHAGSQIFRTGGDADPGLGPWTGLAVLAVWTALALAAGRYALRRRDV